jgi:hypothetical protein
MRRRIEESTIYQDEVRVEMAVRCDHVLLQVFVDMLKDEVKLSVG